MQIRIIKLLIISIIFFIIGVFFIGLNKNSFYDTKNLEGQTLKDIRLDHFSKNNLILDNSPSKVTWVFFSDKSHKFFHYV